MIAEDLKQLTTPELLQLMDDCCDDHMKHQVPNDILENLDAEGVHILQAHSIHQLPADDFIRARAMFKLLGSDSGSQIHLVDVEMSRWDRLPVYEDAE